MMLKTLRVGLLRPICVACGHTQQPVHVKRHHHFASWSSKYIVPNSQMAQFQKAARCYSRKTRFPLFDYTLNYKYTDYDTEKKNFKIDVPEYYNWARDAVDAWADAEKSGLRDSTNPALWWIDETGNEEKLTFQQLSSYSKRVANILTGPCGLKRGDVAIVILPRVIPWWIINIAACRAGIVLSPGTSLLRSGDIKFRINTSGAKCILTDTNCAEEVDKIAHECPGLLNKVFVGSPDDKRSDWLSYNQLFDAASSDFEAVETKSDESLALFFTSGTTGAPKMTEHTHASYGLGHLITARYGLRINYSDVFWNWSDTGWAKSAWSNLFAPWLTGTCIFQQHSSKFNPAEVLRVLQQYPITSFCAAPTAMRFIIKEDLKLCKFPSLKYILCGGEPVNPEMVEQWESGTGIPIYELYGQTESTFLCGVNYTDVKYKEGSMGKTAPGYHIEIVDDKGNVLPRGKEGNLAVKCKPKRPIGLFRKYVDDMERMESVHVGDFYLTGDKAHMDEDGYIFFVGRADDVINSAGYRIGPFEVESALLEHPSVLESAVVSSPDAERGEVVKAFVVLMQAYKDKDEAAMITELQNHVKTVTAPYKYPRKIEIVDDLPKTVSGKIRRVQLRNKEWKRS